MSETFSSGRKWDKIGQRRDVRPNVFFFLHTIRDDNSSTNRYSACKTPIVTNPLWGVRSCALSLGYKIVC